jgi:hypothetical protein
MAIAGKTGIVTITGGSICATEWSVDFSVDRLDVSCFTGDGYREFIAGLKQVTGSITSLDDPGSLDPATLVAVVLTNDDISFSGSAFLNLAVSTPVEGRVEYTYDVQFSGSVTVT